MCLLSVYSPGAVVVPRHLENGAFCNPDGFGFAVIVGDRIEVGKGMDPDAVLQAFIRVREAHPDGWAMFHSRLTPDGEMSEDNCHPFIVGGDERTVLGHNGILPSEARPGKGDVRSDTRILAETLIPRGRFGKLRRARARRNLERWIARDKYPNKVAILTVDPTYPAQAFILGEHHGEWVDGVWHSNDGWKPWKPLKPWRSTPSAKVSDSAFKRYVNGEISLSELLDADPRESGTEFICFACSTDANVDRVYRYCRGCKACLDCFDSIEDCDCWLPQSALNAATMRDDA